MVASEAHPYAKTGGLAEVVAALPSALVRLGHRVTLVLPRYRGIDLSGSRSQATSISIGGRTQLVSFHSREEQPNLTVVFVDVPELFDRAGGLYNADGVDYPDNDWRFAVFSRAALEYARLLGQRPSIIHAHDWQTGLVPVYQKMHFSPDPIVGGVPVIFTIHNLAFQGIFSASTLPALGFGPELMDIQALEYWGQISYLKGGINFSERITTVSPSYAREILTPQLGFGLDGALLQRADELSGILNAIDVSRWNPEADDLIDASFSADDVSGKARAKRVLLETAEYDVKGAKTQNQYFPVSGALTGRETYKYDEKGNISEMTLLNTDGSLLSKEVYKYEFDSIGNWVKMTTAVAVVENQKVVFDPTEITYRTIFYYLDASMVKMVQPANPTSVQLPAASLNNNRSNAVQLPGANLSNSNPANSDRVAVAGDAPAPRILKPVSGGVLNGKALSLPVPLYPQLAVRSRTTGKVEVEVTVDENGKVWVTNSEGPTLLRKAAEDAARGWSFPPTVVGGRPARLAGYLDFDFKL